jgi:phosphate starvation-inducible protein PhoH
MPGKPWLAIHEQSEALGNGQVARYLLDITAVASAEWPILEEHPDAAL